jgi:hypothetical protein
MMVQDLGLTFGHANLLNMDKPGSTNLAAWMKAPIWREPATCTAFLPKSLSGTLEDPKISEAGRKFLADLLVQLSDTQIQNLFETARFVDREGVKSTEESSISDWVAAFLKKRAEIVNHACPA